MIWGTEVRPRQFQAVGAHVSIGSMTSLHILRSSHQGFFWTHCREWCQKGALACRSEDECPSTKSLEDIGNSDSPQLLSLRIDSTICYNCFREPGEGSDYKSRPVALRAPIADGSLLPSRLHRPYGKAIKAERITDPEHLQGIAQARLRGDVCYVDYKKIRRFDLTALAVQTGMIGGARVTS